MLTVGHMYSHWSIDNKGHHNIHVSNVLLQIWIGEVQLCAPNE